MSKSPSDSPNLSYPRFLGPESPKVRRLLFPAGCGPDFALVSPMIPGATRLKNLCRVGNDPQIIIRLASIQLMQAIVSDEYPRVVLNVKGNFSHPQARRSYYPRLVHVGQSWQEDHKTDDRCNKRSDLVSKLSPLRSSWAPI